MMNFHQKMAKNARLRERLLPFEADGATNFVRFNDASPRLI